MNKNRQNFKEVDAATKKSLVFARDVVWVGISLIFTSLMGIITIPVLTRIYGTDVFGIWSLISVTVSLVTPLLTLQFGTAVVRFLANEEDKEKSRRYLGSMLLAILVFSFFMFLLTNLLVEPFSIFLFGSPVQGTFIRLTFAWTFIDSLFMFAISYLRARGRIRRISIIQIVFIILKILLIFVLPNLGLGLEWVISSIILVELVFTLAVYAMIIKEIGFPFPNFTRIGSFLAFSAPQIPSGILLWVINQSDRYFIAHFLGLSETGIYSSSYLLASIIVIFYAPIGYVLLPTLTLSWEQKKYTEVKSYLEYSVKLFLTLAVPASVGITFLSQPLLEILATSEFLAGRALVLLLAIGAVFQGIYQINLYVIYMVKQTKWMPLMILAASLVSAGANFILLPRIGILGAGISNISAYFLLAAIVTVWAKKELSYNTDFKYLGKVIAGVAVMALCLEFMDVSGIMSIFLAVLVAVLVLGLTLLALKAFSREERKLVRKTLAGLIPWLRM